MTEPGTDATQGQGKRDAAAAPGADFEAARTMRQLNRRLAELYAAEPGAWSGTVLEAGSGSFSHFALPPGAAVVLLDIDHGQLLRHASGAPAIQGDLQQLPLATASCSMVVCFNVIEHLDQPGLAMAEMARVLRPGGLLLLGFPQRDSLKGLITRATPIGVHRAYYRWVVGKRDRGGAHYDAFETPMRPLVTARRIGDRLRALGFRVLLQWAYDGSLEYGLTRGSALRRCAALPYYAICAVATLLSAGYWRAKESDALVLARRQAAAEEPA